MKRLRLLFLVRRVGPYHDARFSAAGRKLDLTVVETRPGSLEYPWTTAASAATYRLDGFAKARVPEDGLRGHSLREEIARILTVHQPDVVATAGWADPEYHALLRLCQTRRIPAVVMSDSTRDDEPRRWWKERLKRTLLGNYRSAVAAGTRSREYLADLGFSPDAVSAPWDVVDNAHFARAIPLRQAALPDTSVAPPRRFLCVVRFITKKNLSQLLSVYSRYLTIACEAAWSLTLSGSGPLEGELRAQVARLGIGHRVTFAGFRQYPELPALYADAGALVLPSLSDQWGLVVNEAMAAGLPVLVSQRCGCAPDLVREGRNGYTFDPTRGDALEQVLHRMTQLGARQWQAMSLASRELITGYSPEAFAGGLAEAAHRAVARRENTAPRTAQVLVHLLATRGAPSS